MKKVWTLTIFLLLILPLISANVSVQKLSSGEVLIVGIDHSITFDLKITNSGPSDNFEFYNFLGFDILPVGTTFIGEGQTKNIELKISPIGDFPYRGAYIFEYYIKGQQSPEEREELLFKIIDLADAFEIGSGEISPETSSLEIYIENKVNFNFENINAKFTSAFFDFEEDFSLSPDEKKEFPVQLEKEDFKELTAGFYTINAEITIGNEKADVEGIIKFSEKDIVTTTKKDYGLIINTKVIEKKNEGNVKAESETIMKKNIISRLFTSFSPEPDIVERQDTNVYYTWNRELNPGETLEITVKTNWLFPLLVVAFIITIVILAKQYSRTNLVLRKRVTFVRTKGGEFALKVSIAINAKKYIERVNIIDKLPPLVKVHERFGGEIPTRINEKNKRVEWNFEKLEAGEIRLISYIIYSKIGVLGKFALPSATAIYEKDGKIHETESNKAFFVAEQLKKKPED